jgi:hypothetical protein
MLHLQLLNDILNKPLCSYVIICQILNFPTSILTSQFAVQFTTDPQVNSYS